LGAGRAHRDRHRRTEAGADLDEVATPHDTPPKVVFWLDIRLRGFFSGRVRI
jgi:hypothetical protein